MPRQYKAADKQRSERIEVRLTIDEAHEIITRAINAKVSLSDFLRKSALGSEAYMQKASPDKAALIAELENLNKTGATLGQIVRSGKYANSPEQTELLTQTLQNIKTLSSHLINKLAL